MFNPLRDRDVPSYEPLDTLDKLIAAYSSNRKIECKRKVPLFGVEPTWKTSVYCMTLGPPRLVLTDDQMEADFDALEYRALIEKAPPILFDSDVSPAV